MVTFSFYNIWIIFTASRYFQNLSPVIVKVRKEPLHSLGMSILKLTNTTQPIIFLQNVQ